MLDKFFINHSKTKKILNKVEEKTSLQSAGLTGSRLAFFMGNIFSELSDKNILLITGDRGKAETHYENLIRMVDKEKVLLFPEIEVFPHEKLIPDYHVRQERLQVLQECLFGNYSKIIIAPVTALLRKIMPPDVFREYAFHLKIEQEIDLDFLKEKLSILGYQREDMVEEPGHFSVRGGIIDVYMLSEEHPFRIEFFGDEIDSIRTFDAGTQRSISTEQEVVIPPAEELILIPEIIEKKLPKIKSDFQEAVRRLEKSDQPEKAYTLQKKRDEVLEKLTEFNRFPGYTQFLPYFFSSASSLFDYLGKSSSVFIEHYPRIEERVENNSRDIRETTVSLLQQGQILPTYEKNFVYTDEFNNLLRDKAGFYFVEDFYDISLPEKFEEINFSTSGVEPFHSQLELFADRLQNLTDQGYRILVSVDSQPKAERIERFIKEKELPLISVPKNLKRGTISVLEKSLSEGFILEDFKLAVYTEKEVFGTPQKRKKRLTSFEEGVKISSAGELNAGDYVVHENHGIGRYLGIKSLEVQNQHQDYLVLQYAGDDKLYVPTDKVDLVQKYVGADDSPPRLYELGGNKWERVKEKVENSVKEMAVELLELYAERETVEGYKFSSDTDLQTEFEDEFSHQETPDQLAAIEDIKEDMESSTPMDRLLCGDVGYGKTEVAIRAAFKAAVDSKQTAFLVPTTILAQQHFNTFKERLSGYPVEVEMISRFRTTAEQKEIVEKLARGEIDIIIGTHRLLSKDIIFNDLGLLVIDEEQRFGVSHKEQIKDLKRNLDVLTLSATPIPRTLHMALAGVRDMSLIETPPRNRYPIRTYIREFEEALIKDSFRREMDRDGQIYFVHNRVEDINKKADQLRELVPEANIAVAHGQMSENRLEQIMHDFYHREYDVLVCTTIIENGLDIQNVNTIIINRADRMGLAQLYQLRGRVGRTNRIAYAYLLYKKDRVLSEVAEKRLKAIKEFTNLGSGFKIAMRDLEIRGAGNLLGPEQHGHIAAIGFSLYCKLLENAVEELKGEKEETKELEIDLGLDAYLPDDYIPDSRQKIEIYKKIEEARSESQIEDIKVELKDRFGDLPEVVNNLVEMGSIRIKAKSLGVEKINRDENIIYLHFEGMESLEGAEVMDLIDKYPRKIKIRSANKPVIGVKTSGNGFPDLLEEVLNNLARMVAA